MIPRKTIIERSVDRYLRTQLFTVRGYPSQATPGQPNKSWVEVLDAYPDNERMHQPLNANYIAIGFAHDDGGKFAEIGSSAKTRKHTSDFYIFAINRVWGSNLAGVLESSLESDGVINLLDPRTDGVIGYVDVDFVSAQQAVTRTPRPWEENAWIVRLRVEDNYYDSSGFG